jgi:hypothetical protein
VVDPKNLFRSSEFLWACERISSKLIHLATRPPEDLSALLWDFTSTQRQDRELISGDNPVLRQSYVPLTGCNPVQLLVFLLDITPREGIST